MCLGLGGAQKDTAFTRTHDCLYEFIRWLSAARLGGEIGEDVAMCEFERIWQADGPTDHLPSRRTIAAWLIAWFGRSCDWAPGNGSQGRTAHD